MDNVGMILTGKRRCSRRKICHSATWQNERRDAWCERL